MGCLAAWEFLVFLNLIIVIIIAIVQSDFTTYAPAICTLAGVFLIPFLFFKEFWRFVWRIIWFVPSLIQKPISAKKEKERQREELIKQQKSELIDLIDKGLVTREYKEINRKASR